MANVRYNNYYVFIVFYGDALSFKIFFIAVEIAFSTGGSARYYLITVFSDNYIEACVFRYNCT